MNKPGDINYRRIPEWNRAGRNFSAPGLLFVCIMSFLLSLSTHANAAASFGYAGVVEKAKQLASKPFQERGNVPDFLLKLDYNQWRNIRFKPARSLWRSDKLPFEVQFFHPGFLYSKPIKINVIASGRVGPVRFSPELFNYSVAGIGDKVPKDLGFAGFRLHYPLNTRKYYDEVIVFLGASYFRIVGAGQGFGLSARGLAVDTAETSGEEFPSFTEFWLVRPSAGAKKIVVYALLDSPSLAGGYRFVIHPGKETVVDVTSTFYMRKKVKKLGIAPLTSMFFYGENINIRPDDNYRPKVADSDGLMIASGMGEWIWRPLINPKKLMVTSFQLNRPKGFGLFMRDRKFDHYQDLESLYERRPSAWIIPKKGFGKGKVELVLIPTDTDRNDNIVSYWVPDSLSSTFSYQMRWGPVDVRLPPLGRVVSTRTSTGVEKSVKLYLVDFDGARLRSLHPNALVKADVSIGGAGLVGQQIYKNIVTGGWRLVLHVKKKEGTLEQVIPQAAQDASIELRASLRLRDEVITETWSYLDSF